ncbi:MAG TPA: hypothetical protein VFX67_03290 [Burkholderiales bacterium]|nr:hypothetical protein [Burkholderiales bacterium]
MLLLLVAALPLRGYAALAADVCTGHHGGVVSAHAAQHDHDADHPHEAPETNTSTSSGCSHCASCSVGATVAPEAKQISLPVAGADRIPFFDRRKPGHVPDHPERPPLVS